MSEARIVSPMLRRLVKPLFDTPFRGPGGGAPPPTYIPRLWFNDNRNSQYVPLVFRT